MTAAARRAIAVIRGCVDGDRFAVTVHFAKRMEQRGLFWPDVQAVIDNPDDVLPRGTDEYDRPKWALSGEAGIGGDIEIICTIELDETEMEFITLYWKD